MKKKILLVTLFLSVFLSGMAVADSINGNYKGNPIVRVSVNGQAVQSEVPAQIIDGSTLLPLRSISESLGANVKWSPDNYSVAVTLQNPGLPLAQLNKIGESVGLVYGLDASGVAVSQGSGFLLDGGIFITCNHVIANTTTALRIDLNGKSYTSNGQYLFRNAETDIAAVKIDASGGLEYTKNLPTPGEKVYSLGFPGQKFQINEGMFAYMNGDNKIVHFAKTAPGSSGGILISDKGKVAGITSATVINSDYNEAIPMSVVQQELQKLQ